MKGLKKYIVAMAVFVFVMFTLLGCDDVDGANDIFELVDRESIFGNKSLYIFRENSTDVLYVAYDNGYPGGLTVMLDTDGSPILYSEWKDRVE